MHTISFAMHARDFPSECEVSSIFAPHELTLRRRRLYISAEAEENPQRFYFAIGHLTSLLMHALPIRSSRFRLRRRAPAGGVCHG